MLRASRAFGLSFLLLIPLFVLGLACAPEEPAMTEEGEEAAASATMECKSDGDCGADQFCKRKIGDCEGVGMCADKPQACPDVFDPVCGCDGKTYGNECEADAAGVSVAHKGECEAGAACKSNDDCPADAYCSKAIGDCEGEGSCEPRPEICTKEFKPVCGCDGKTYGNACEAAAAGVSVASEGECPKPA